MFREVSTILWVCWLSSSASFIDLEELKTSLYSVAILDKPVPVTKDPTVSFDKQTANTTVAVKIDVSENEE